MHTNFNIQIEIKYILNNFFFSNRSLYELNFLEAKPAKGFYKLTISVVPKKSDAKLIGTTGAEVWWKKYF